MSSTMVKQTACHLTIWIELVAVYVNYAQRILTGLNVHLQYPAISSFICQLNEWPPLKECVSRAKGMFFVRTCFALNYRSPISVQKHNFTKQRIGEYLKQCNNYKGDSVPHHNKIYILRFISNLLPSDIFHQEMQ